MLIETAVMHKYTGFWSAVRRIAKLILVLIILFSAVNVAHRPLEGGGRVVPVPSFMFT